MEEIFTRNICVKLFEPVVEEKEMSFKTQATCTRTCDNLQKKPNHHSSGLGTSI